MIEITVEILSDVLEVDVTFPPIGLSASGIDEGNSTTTYSNTIIDI